MYYSFSVRFINLPVTHRRSLFSLISIFWVTVLCAGYRRKIVDNNLKSHSRKKSDAERKAIAKNSTWNFVDSFIET